MKVFKAFLILFFGYSCLASASHGQSVLDIAPGSRFEQIGLVPGDRIISYDNHAVNSVQDSMEMYNKLGNNEINYLAIERNGKKVIVAAKERPATPPPPMEYEGTKKLKKTSKNYPTPVLEEARCIPWRDPSTGEFTRTNCEDRSVKKGNQEIFQKIGVSRMEVLKIEDGGNIEAKDLETIDSEQKAMELYNTMKTTGATQLGTERQ